MKLQSDAIESLEHEKVELIRLLDNSPRYQISGTHEDTIRKLKKENSELKRKLRDKEEEVGNLRSLVDKSKREPGTGYVIYKATYRMIFERFSEFFWN